MPETPKKITLARGLTIATIRHIKFDTATGLLEATCFVRNDDVRARFITGNGRTSAAYLRIDPNDFEPFAAEVMAAFPPGAFERLELNTIVSYRRAIARDETVHASGRPRRSRKGFGPRNRFPNSP